MEENNKDIPLLTEDEVWDVISFARQLSNGLYGSSYLNPELISSRMKDVTLNPLAATQESLDVALKDPKSNEAQLQKFSQSFELSSMVYKRLISYLANMLSFDITYTSTAESKDYTTLKYKKDLSVVETFLNNFDYKQEFRIAIREMLRNDAYFGCFRETKDGYILQELPSEYCKITGRWEGGFLFSFNMYWFVQPGVDIDMYPPFFKKKFKELFLDENRPQGYYPHLPPEIRGDSSWIYWVDIPVEFGVCFKLSPELATRLPYFTPLFSDLILQTLMRNLQKNVNMAAASRMIIGQVPMLNRDTKATVRDSIAVSPDLLGKFLTLLKGAISESIRVASAPLEDMQGISFDSNNDMYDSYLRTALASSGINTNLIFTSDVKPNAIETQLSLNVDEQMMQALYSQFNSMISYHINRRTKNFTFYCVFEGSDFFIDRKNRYDKAMGLFEKGIVMPQKIAASIGLKPSQMRKHMEEAAATGFMDMLTPPSFEQDKELAEMNQEASIKAAEVGAQNNPSLPSSRKTDSKTSAQKGRPKKNISELGEEGMKTQETGANIGRGGKI